MPDIRLRAPCTGTPRLPAAPHPATGPTWTLLATGSAHVLAIRYDWRGNEMVVVHNFSREPCEARVGVEGDRGDCLVTILADDESRAGADGRHRIALESYGYHGYRVGGLDCALRHQRAAGFVLT